MMSLNIVRNLLAPGVAAAGGNIDLLIIEINNLNHSARLTYAGTLILDGNEVRKYSSRAELMQLLKLRVEKALSNQPNMIPNNQVGD